MAKMPAKQTPPKIRKIFWKILFHDLIKKYHGRNLSVIGFSYSCFTVQNCFYIILNYRGRLIIFSKLRVLKI